MIQALGTGDRPRGIQPRETALSQDRDHDRRRRRRRPYPHAAADLLLPPDARADRGRASLHRPAAALQGRPRPLRSLSQGRQPRSTNIWSTPGSTAWCSKAPTASAAAPTCGNLVDHARRMRTLMRYAPRKYDPALIEALAINGALKPTLDDDGRAKAIAKVAAWLDAADLEADWSGEVAAEGGYLLRRLWRGVTDAHVIEPGFLGLGRRRASSTRSPPSSCAAYAGPSTLRRYKKGAAPAPEAPLRRPTSKARTRRRSRGRRGSRKPRARRSRSRRPSELLDAVLAAGRRGPVDLSATRAWAK